MTGLVRPSSRGRRVIVVAGLVWLAAPWGQSVPAAQAGGGPLTVMSFNIR